jgi:uncharacterized membrane protein
VAIEQQSEQRRLEWQAQREPYRSQPINVGSTERMVSVAAGSILAAFGVSRRSFPGTLMAAVGGMMLYRGVRGHCHVYDALHINTAQPQADWEHERTLEEIARDGIQIEQAFLINRSPEDLYQFWRNFENLPRIMDHLHSVRVIDDRRSHWVAKAPSIAGGEVAWDAHITDDQPNQLIAWQSDPGSEVDNAGEIRFSPAMGDRGTEVHVKMSYIPPAGTIGHWIAKLLGESPEHQIREGLRNFKRLMETGEVPTIIGQPKGTCSGVGKRVRA